jgi:hypothetical protein
LTSSIDAFPDLTMSSNSSLASVHCICPDWHFHNNTKAGEVYLTIRSTAKEGDMEILAETSNTSKLAVIANGTPMRVSPIHM